MTPEEMEDLYLDDVFVNPENPVRVVQEPPVAPPPVETQAQPTTAEPFLKTRTGTVYKNAEDAAQGIEHKDQLIAKLRQEAIARSGVDPLTAQPVRIQEPVKSYTQDSKRFIEDLSKAAQANDAEAYRNVQAQLIQDVLAPYAPVLAGLAKTQAIDSVTAKTPEFRQFFGTEEYNQTLDKFPTLKDAIAQSEGNPQQTRNLEEFYQMTFQLANAGKVPEVVRAQAQPTPRPTVTSTALPSMPQSSQLAHQPGLDSAEARRALIEQQERSGVLNIRM